MEKNIKRKTTPYCSKGKLVLFVWFIAVKQEYTNRCSQYIWVAGKFGTDLYDL